MTIMKYAGRFLITFILLLFVQIGQGQEKRFNHGKRVVIIMMDGFGMSYFNGAPMPHLKALVAKGFFKQVNALMPTITNANNTSICTATFPEVNGISGNFILNDKGEEE